MIISKAIEILDYLHKSNEFEWNPDTQDAIKLGAEALKRFQNCRLHPGLQFHCPLPGESIPERGIR